jgi:hypothetical protein
MNTVPIIRKGTYKDYLYNGAIGGFILGVLFSLISLLKNSISTSIWIGFGLWIAIVIIYMSVGFLSEEYFRRKKKIKKLLCPKYSFLHNNEFTVHQDLFFEGLYGGYYFRVIPMTQWQRHQRSIDYDIIEVFYSFDIDKIDADNEERLSGDYSVGTLYYAKNCVGFLPQDWESPDFKANFDGLIRIIQGQGLKPMTKDEWDELHGIALKEEKEKEMQRRTKQILKIGKLDIEYVKPEKKGSLTEQ